MRKIITTTQLLNILSCSEFKAAFGLKLSLFRSDHVIWILCRYRFDSREITAGGGKLVNSVESPLCQNAEFFCLGLWENINLHKGQGLHIQHI